MKIDQEWLINAAVGRLASAEGPNWGSAQAPALQAITATTFAPPRRRQSRECRIAAIPEPSSFMFVTGDSRRGTFQPVGSGNVFGDMKYSFPCLLSGRRAYLFTRFFFIILFFFKRPVTGSEERYSQSGNDSLSAAL